MDGIAKSFGSTHRGFGDHQWMAFPNHPIDKLPELPRQEWEPLKVGAALGRVMAIVRLRGRRPSVEELDGEPTGIL